MEELLQSPVEAWITDNPESKNIRRTHFDAHFFPSLGENVNNNTCCISTVDTGLGEGTTDRYVRFACFDLPPLKN